MSSRATRVYVAGPITGSGNLLLNVRSALVVASKLLKLGYAPYVPHLNCFWEIVCEESYETWLALDKEFLITCDAMLRLPGHSPGADREEAWARERGIPVYRSVEALQAVRSNRVEE